MVRALPMTAEEAVSDLLCASTSLRVEELSHNPWLTSGIWRVCSETQCLIVKELRPPVPSDKNPWDKHWTKQANIPSHWNFWKREALVYESNIFEKFQWAGISPPPILAIHNTDDCIYIYLEHIGGSASQWKFRRYAQAAHALGQAQGRAALNGGVPEVNWLSSNYLRDYVAEKPFEFELLNDKTAWRQEFIRDFPMDLRTDLKRFADQRERLLQIAASLPQTLCHNDFWTRNLFGEGVGLTQLIDWAFTGAGCVGQDIGNLVPSAVLDGFVAPQYFSSLEQATVNAYLRGLRQAGWKEDLRLARLGVYASAVKYVWLGPAMLSSALDPEHPVYAGYGGGSISSYFWRVGHTLNFLTEWADRAVQLAEKLKLSV